MYTHTLNFALGEDIEAAGGSGDNRLPAMIERTVFLGSTTQVMVRLAQGSLLQALVTNTESTDQFTSGQSVTVRLPAQRLRVLESSSASVWHDAGEGDEPIAV